MHTAEARLPANLQELKGPGLGFMLGRVEGIWFRVEGLWLGFGVEGIGWV